MCGAARRGPGWGRMARCERRLCGDSQRGLLRSPPLGKRQDLRGAFYARVGIPQGALLGVGRLAWLLIVPQNSACARNLHALSLHPPAPVLRMRVFVLTGGIGCGKSTVARLLNCNNIAVIDSDVLARRVVEPGMPGRRAIYRAFGDTVFRKGEGGQVELDRAALARTAFADESGRRKKLLERCTHPYINRMLVWQLLRISLGMRQTEGVAPGCTSLPAPAAVCLDIPLFYEAGLARDGPLALLPVVCVSVQDRETQISRILARSEEPGAPTITREDAENRIARQLPVSSKAELAAFVIDNSGEQALLETEVERLLGTDIWAACRLRQGREQGVWEDEMQEKRRALRARSVELTRAREELLRRTSNLPNAQSVLHSFASLRVSRHPGGSEGVGGDVASGASDASDVGGRVGRAFSQAATPEEQRAMQRVSDLEAAVRRISAEVATPGPVTTKKFLLSWIFQHMFLVFCIAVAAGCVLLALGALLAERLIRGSLK